MKGSRSILYKILAALLLTFLIPLAVSTIAITANGTSNIMAWGPFEIFNFSDMDSWETRFVYICFYFVIFIICFLFIFGYSVLFKMIRKASSGIWEKIFLGLIIVILTIAAITLLTVLYGMAMFFFQPLTSLGSLPHL